MIELRAGKALFIAALALVAPTLLSAQQAGQGAPAAAQQEEVEALLTEFQSIHMQLEDIQMRALRDPQLSAAQEELGQEIRDAMESRDPSLRQRMERIEVIESEATSAQEKGDVAALQRLMSEAQQIEQHFISIQQQVLEVPAIASKLDAFQQRLERKMQEVNPETPSLIARFRQIESRLMQLHGGA